jgi:hypothetical protein
MPALVHFAPSLTQGNLTIGPSSVNTQVNGLVEVSIDYICRESDLEAQIEKFYVDAPPPIFPTRGISPSNLQQGKLFMVNYGVTQQYGVATINARYAGVTSKAVRPFKTFSYSDFAVGAKVYVSLTGNFGGGDFLPFNEPDNDFLGGSNNYSMTVGMRGRVESIKYTWASLDTDAVPTSLPARPTAADAIADIELIAGAISYRTDLTGRFGNVFSEAVWQEIAAGQLEQSYQPVNVGALEVLQYAAQQNGLVGLVPRVFDALTIDQWTARGVGPQILFSISRRSEAVTPSVYIREIEYKPSVR